MSYSFIAMAMSPGDKPFVKCEGNSIDIIKMIIAAMHQDELVIAPMFMTAVVTFMKDNGMSFSEMQKMFKDYPGLDPSLFNEKKY